ncbi:hypothetical protein [Streptomyces sp. C10-9-1]|uniref:hypothetical protein n=1 Tax=Streptomyces sp. C10-9-1 TaxID=1859285 RepID=UPI003D72FB96
MSLRPRSLPKARAQTISRIEHLADLYWVTQDMAALAGRVGRGTRTDLKAQDGTR